MGDVLSLAAFRDRRGLPPAKPVEADVEFANKDALHTHLRTLHGYGGPRSQTRADLERIHQNRHTDPQPLGTPHQHR